MSSKDSSAAIGGQRGRQDLCLKIKGYLVQRRVAELERIESKKKRTKRGRRVLITMQFSV